MALALTGALLGSVCQTLVPLIARQIIDGVIVRRDSPLWPWLALLVVVAVARFGFTYLRRYRGGRVGLEVQYDLRNAMHDHLQTMDLDNLDRMPTGQLVARASSDSMLVQGLLNYMPIIGPSMGVILFLFVGLLTSETLWQALLPAGLYLMIHLIEGEAVTPMLLARRFTLNPAIVIISLIFWFWMWGVPGAVLAVPMLAVTKIICDGVKPLEPIGHFLEG